MPGGGVVSTDDDGASWTTTLPGGDPDIHCIVADPLHPPVIGAAEPEDELRTCATHCLGPGDQAMPVERWRERQRARAGDDRLVEVKESCGSSASSLDGGTHGPAA